MNVGLWPGGFDWCMAPLAEARRVLRQLDQELANASKRTGRNLVWTAVDKELRTLIADTIDRKADLAVLYDATPDPTSAKLDGMRRLGPPHM